MSFLKAACQHIMIKLDRWNSELTIFYLIVVLGASGIPWFIRSEIHWVGRVLVVSVFLPIQFYGFASIYINNLYWFKPILHQFVYQRFRICRFDSCFFQIGIRHFCEAQPRYIDDTSCHGGVGGKVGNLRALPSMPPPPANKTLLRGY